MELIARTYSRGCAQNEQAMWMITIVETMLIDRHATSVIIPLMSGVSSFTLSMWRSPAVVAIAKIAGWSGDRHD
ncbi:hypothetical protein Y032_0072g633 [Ancylostoma ceylanicum]|uniref:Uncharacterized protein n=1 Tax=Ancylostoma ceylanicum TaxID=53326 RepID=A0A016TWJ6_9BILA|nr:hypothetical protein Y032_0072g633 [Ancylostoma ceylanicum]